jgi:uncharacterized membrane protein
VGGLLLLFATPGSIRRLAVVLTQGELSEDPRRHRPLLVTYRERSHRERRSLRRRLFIAARRGQVVLVIALLLNKLWAYPSMIVVLLIFYCYQLYRIVLQPSAGWCYSPRSMR